MTKRYTPGPPDDEKRRAIRRSEADLVSAWDNYAAAIDAAKGGDQTRLVNLLRGHLPGTVCFFRQHARVHRDLKVRVSHTPRRFRVPLNLHFRVNGVNNPEEAVIASARLTFQQ